MGYKIDIDPRKNLLAVDSSRIICAEQSRCPFFLPWAGPIIRQQLQRSNIRCEYAGNDHRCRKCSTGEQCGEYDFRCISVNNSDPKGGRKKINIIILKEEGK